MNLKKENIDLSVIVPLYNEEECIQPLYDAIVQSIEPLHMNYEILFVDDGSKDATFSKSKELAGKDGHLRVIKFRKNYGQTAGMSAGIDHARGKILVTMDGDLQNDPSDIPKFLKKIEEGNDVVCGWRHKRQDKLITRKIPSVVANWIIGKITGVPIKDNGCSLKAYRAEVIKGIPLYSDMHRFIPAMSSLAGTQVAELKVNHHARKFGVSKYGITRIYKVIIDLLVIKTILSFVSKPLRLFGIGAGISLVAGLLILIGAFSNVFEGNMDINFMMASGALLFFILSFFLVMVGLICELVNKTGSPRNFAHIKMRVE
jgi:glycosyltransferase involved in cell wall biosynthesis